LAKSTTRVAIATGTTVATEHFAAMIVQQRTARRRIVSQRDLQTLNRHPLAFQPLA